MEWMKQVHKTAAPAGPALSTGDDVRIWYKIREQDRERLGQFEGVVIRCRGSGPSRTVTVRRVTFGEGVERVFPLDAPVIDHIELLRRGKVRRSRIYFLRRVVKRTRLATAESLGTGTAPSGAAPAARPPAPANAVEAAKPAEGGTVTHQPAEDAVASTEKPVGGRRAQAKT